ncbi:hypothetical protein BV25DRAFT_1772471, partial [Artomyces pyxidatus]
NTPEGWKHASFMSIFSIQAPYKPPKNIVAQFIWRWRMRFECICALTVLEPWEKALYPTIVGVVLTALATWAYYSLPQHLTSVYERTMFHLLGAEGGE